MKYTLVLIVCTYNFQLQIVVVQFRVAVDADEHSIEAGRNKSEAENIVGSIWPLIRRISVLHHSSTDAPFIGHGLCNVHKGFNNGCGSLGYGILILSIQNQSVFQHTGLQARLVEKKTLPKMRLCPSSNLHIRALKFIEKQIFYLHPFQKLTDQCFSLCKIVGEIKE